MKYLLFFCLTLALLGCQQQEEHSDTAAVSSDDGESIENQAPEPEAATQPEVTPPDTDSSEPETVPDQAQQDNQEVAPLDLRLHPGLLDDGAEQHPLQQPQLLPDLFQQPAKPNGKSVRWQAAPLFKEESGDTNSEKSRSFSAPKVDGADVSVEIDFD